MTHSPPIRLEMLRLWWPLLIENLAGGLVTFVDLLFISQISDKAAASIGMLSSVLWLGYFILPQFNGAGVSVASQYIGAKKNEFVVPTYLGCLLLSGGLGIVLSVALFLLSPVIGLWYGMTPEQNSYSELYLQVIVFNFILVGLRGAYYAVLASQTLTKWNMITSVIINVLNVALAALLSHGWGPVPAMGIPGIALATILSYAAGLGILAWVVHGRLKVTFFVKGLWSKTVTALRAILKIGIPSALEPLSYTAQSALVAAFVISLGYVAMGANTFVFQLLFLDLAVSFSLTSAGQIIMSHHLGARKLDLVNKTYFRVLYAAGGAAFVIILTIIAFSHPILSLFTTDPAIMVTAQQLLWLSLFIEPIRVANILSGVALKSVGDGKFSLTIGLIFMWAVVPLMLIALAFNTGIIGLWVCLLLDEGVRAAVNVWRWKSGAWRHKTVIGSEQS